MPTPLQLKKLYNQGQNVSAFMRREMGVEYNTREIIEVSYDLQTGSYIAAMENEEIAEHKEEYSRQQLEVNR